MDGDRPIRRIEDDRLGFGPVAEHLARAIVDQAAKDGLVFGIEGKWGSGKSTLIDGFWIVARVLAISVLLLLVLTPPLPNYLTRPCSGPDRP